jgi:hypothetical protein
MEAADSSKMMVRVYQTTQCHIQEDSNLNIHCHEKQKYHTCDIKSIKYITYIEVICA